MGLGGRGVEGGGVVLSLENQPPSANSLWLLFLYSILFQKVRACIYITFRSLCLCRLQLLCITNWQGH